MTDQNRYLSQREFVTLKTRLTRALNSRDPRKILAEVAHFKTTCDGRAMPDNWSRWQRAADDAYLQALRDGDRDVQRVEL